MSDGPQSQDRESAGRGDDQTAMPPGNVRPPGLEDIEDYRLIELIGEGGMGEVYKAEQRGAIRRMVALKVIRLGLDTKTVVARFDAERQALALMNHPNIAKVFDGGSTKQGRPYFVMEYVAGEPITLYCDRHRLPIRARLELFAQVCDAVQHAHTKGIIHRDLKASNVLVTEQDGKPVPKVIDFGVAKATNQRLTEQTLFTETGRLVGTPAYSSPEQAEGSVDVDTRSDVYSLGVMLYELLTGALPFDPTQLRALAYGEMQRIIREVDPPRPSTFYSKPTEASREAAQRRAATVEELASTLRNELEWIPLRAMRKERGERYQTASDLAREIESYLSGRPLIAAPDSRLYRWRKALHRNRGLAAAVGAVILTLLLGILMTSWQAWRAQQQKGLAEQNAAEAQKRLAHATASAQLLDEIFKGILPDVVQRRDTQLLKELLRRTEPRLRQILTEPAWRAWHLVLLGDAFRVLGDYDKARELLDEARSLAQQTYDAALAAGRFEPDFKEVRTLIEALEKRGNVDLELGRIAAAESLFREALRLAEAHLPPGDANFVDRWANVASALRLSGAHKDSDTLAEALRLCDQAIRLADSDPQRDPEDHARLRTIRATILFAQEDFQAMEREIASAEQRYREAGKEQSSASAMLLSLRGSVAHKLSDYRAARQHLTSAIEMRDELAAGIDLDQQIRDLELRSLCHERLRQPHEAAQDLLRAIEIRDTLRNTSIEGQWALMQGTWRAGWLLQESARLEESRAALSRGLELASSFIEQTRTTTRQSLPQGADTLHITRLEWQQRWAQVSLALGHADEALPVIRDCLAQQQKVYQPNDLIGLQWVAASQLILAECLLAGAASQEQQAEALVLLLDANTKLARANATVERTIGNRPRPREAVLNRLIAYYESIGDATEALRWSEERRKVVPVVRPGGQDQDPAEPEERGSAPR